jgi:APA family basic amino acid/polyamine antiporter
MSTTSDPQPAPALFTRKATGLVREARATDALFYNVMWASVALAFSFYWLFYGAYQGSNAWVAFLIAACLGLPGAFLYAMLAQIMPRTGGDYVFNSRSLHPSVGFAGNFSYCVWLAVIYGVYTTYLATYGFGAFGRMMAGFTGSHAWLDFGDWFSKDYALFITGTVMLLLSAAVFIVGGLHLFLRLQVVAFVLYALGAFLLPVIVGVFQSKTGFLGNFQDYAANLGAPHATGALAASANKAGFASTTGFDTETTLKSVSLFWYIFGFLYSSNYFAGEIRLRRRTHLVSIPGALAVSAIGIALLLLAYQGVTGYTFNGRLGFADPAAYGFAAGAPAYPEIMAIASGTWVLGAVMIIGFAVGLLIWLPQTMLLVSRSMFSWSFDRIMPARLSYVDARTRSPVIAIAIVTLLAIGSTAIYAFTTWFSAISVLLGLSLTLLVTAVGGIALPFRQRAMVENSPYSRRIAGISIVSIVAFVALIGFSLGVAVILWDPGSGASLSANPGKLWLALGIYALAFVIYFVSRAVRRSQGIDLSLTYRELPPE